MMPDKTQTRPVTGNAHKIKRAGSLALLAAFVALATPIFRDNVRASDSDPAAPTPVSLGEKIFSDASLSASGTMSCATCHDPQRAHAQNNALSVQFGGPRLDVGGTRAVPSLRYVSTIPVFNLDDGPVGGFNRDGRAIDLIDQASRPLLSPNEMANTSADEVVAKLAAAPYAAEFQRVFGANIFDDVDTAFLAIRFSLAQYQKFAPEFRPFDSKYDYFLKGKARLDPAELRGLALFNRADKGNCAACHPSQRGPKGEPPLFTDFSYDNLGVPRNDDIPANADPEYADMGLCGPFRTDLVDSTDLCGAFKVPTLRNVATRQVFFHNGRFHTLRDALRFYARRDTNPEQFFPTDADGVVQKFNDLPPELRAGVNTSEVPYDRQLGDEPRLSEAELDDLEAFLNTLTDGYQPSSN